jgi:hypothetical protein
MSKLVNLFIDFDKLNGLKNYMTWSHHMQNTLIFNDLWKYICNGEKAPIKLINARELAKWELRDEKALALLRSYVTDEMFIHIENEN